MCGAVVGPSKMFFRVDEYNYIDVIYSSAIVVFVAVVIIIIVCVTFNLKASVKLPNVSDV